MIIPDHFQSPLGVATCDTCRSEWPCHATAWGPSRAVSSCKVRGCDGMVSWKLPDVVVSSCDA